jgi:hypothetical protein
MILKSKQLRVKRVSTSRETGIADLPESHAQFQQNQRNCNNSKEQIAQGEEGLNQLGDRDLQQ